MLHKIHSKFCLPKDAFCLFNIWSSVCLCEPVRYVAVDSLTAAALPHTRHATLRGSSRPLPQPAGRRRTRDRDATAAMHPHAAGGAGKATAPYGSWESPISAAAVSAAGRTAEGLAVAGDGRLVWVETRPEEGGYAQPPAPRFHGDRSEILELSVVLFPFRRQARGPREGTGGARRQGSGCDAAGVRGALPRAGVRRWRIRRARGRCCLL